MSILNRRTRPSTPAAILLAHLRHHGDADVEVPVIDSRRADAVLALAREHRVSGLLARSASGGEHDLPPTVRDALEQDRLLATTNHLVALRTIAELSERLPAPFLVVKGPVLAAEWYRDPGARRYTDIDLLIAPTDLRAVVERLHEIGFGALATNWAGFRRHDVAEIPVERGGVTLDLHWDLIGLGRHRRAFDLDVRAMTSRATSIPLGGVPTATLDATDTLHHLCIHAGLGGARRLLHLHDIHVVAMSGQIDWAAFAARSRAARSVNLVSVVLRRAHHVLGTPLPTGFDDGGRHPSRGWNRVVDGVERFPRRRALPVSVHVEGARDGLRDLVAATALGGLEATRVALGGSSRTDIGGDLSWQAPEAPDEAVAEAREAYLTWVDAGAPRYVIRASRDPDHLDALFGHLEPRSSPALGYIHSRDILGRSVRSYVVRRTDGMLSGLIVMHRPTPLVMLCLPIVLDPAAGAAIASFVDRSAATVVYGRDPDVRPLSCLLTRQRKNHLLRSGAAPYAVLRDLDFTVPDNVVAVRVEDIEALTDLVTELHGDSMTNRLLARRWAQRWLALGSCMIRADGRPVGFVTLESRSRRFDVVGTIGVLPEFQGRGYSWSLIAGLAARAVTSGSGLMGVARDENPMREQAGFWVDEPGLAVELREPRRFKGEPRLWRAASRLLAGSS